MPVLDISTGGVLIPVQAHMLISRVIGYQVVLSDYKGHDRGASDSDGRTRLDLHQSSPAAATRYHRAQLQDNSSTVRMIHIYTH